MAGSGPAIDAPDDLLQVLRASKPIEDIAPIDRGLLGPWTYPRREIKVGHP